MQAIRMADDPLAGRSTDEPLPIKLIEPGHLTTGNVPQGIQNWDFYDGAIVTVGITDGELYTVYGSGVVVAPGLIVTATHVLRDFANEIKAKRVSLYCVGMRSSGFADLWVLRSLSFAEGESDIAFLGVELNSEIDDDWQVSCLPISTRAPAEGEPLTIVGYRFDLPEKDAEALPDLGVPPVGVGQLYAAAGETTALYYPKRDPILVPFPAIEIGCGSLGGMSGGAVIDKGGALVGLLSRSFQSDDGRGPSTAAWIIYALMFEVTLPWPVGAYPRSTALLDLPDELLTVYGRDKIHIVGPKEIEYSSW